jgi:hypothetical protein
MPQIAEIKLPSCGLEVADIRKNCDFEVAVAELRLQNCNCGSASFKLQNCDCGLICGKIRRISALHMIQKISLIIQTFSRLLLPLHT